MIFSDVTNKVDSNHDPPDFDLMALPLMSVVLLIFPNKIKQLLLGVTSGETIPQQSLHTILWPSQPYHHFILPILPTFLLGGVLCLVLHHGGTDQLASKPQK